MEQQILETHRQLVEEEKLFATDTDNSSSRIDNIKELLLKIKTLEESKIQVEDELRKMEKTWIKNDEMNRKRRELLINSMSSQIHLISTIMISWLKARQTAIDDILYYEKQILLINSYELKERERNIWYINEAKEIIKQVMHPYLKLQFVV